MSGCNYFEQLISQALDGELSSAEEQELCSHLRTCPDCRLLAEALTGISGVMRDGTVDPPESLYGSVMERIEADDSESENEPIPISHARQRASRPWMKTLIAACLVIVIGAAGISVIARSLRAGSSAHDIAEERAAAAEDANTYGALYEDEAPMEMEPAPMPLQDGATAAGSAQEAADAEPAAAEPEAEEAAVASYTTAESDSDEARMIALQERYTLDTPAEVPSGREADFESLIHSSGPDDSGTRFVFAYVEYRGVIYEFSTGDEGELIWRDAAEGMLSRSPGTLEDFLDIFE